MTLLHRLITAAREGRRAATRAWRASAVLDARERAQRLRLAGMTDHELERCSNQWAGAVTYGELRRRGLPVPGER